jgi:hypothetical protein
MSEEIGLLSVAFYKLNAMKYLKDFSFWLLLAINAYLVLVYLNQPNSISLIIVLYWFQSFFMGFFNFLTILSFKNPGTIVPFLGSKTKQAFFFLFHYSFFHLGLLIFLIASSMISSSVINQYLITSLWLLLASQAIEFVQSKFSNVESGIDIQQLFFLPYLRVIPLVILILGLKYLPGSFGLAFLLIKILIDIFLYFLYQSLMRNHR